MVFLIVWLLVVFVGFSWMMYLAGKTTCDRKWFARLNFSAAAQETAFSHMANALGSSAIMFIFLLVGVVAYVTAPRNVPTTIGRMVTSSCFTLAVFGIGALQFWLDHRRESLAKQEEDKQKEDFIRNARGGE